jgi:hypothetical protein
MSRNIFGWDLPPGVSTRDIENAVGGDSDAEAFYDSIYDEMVEITDEALKEKLAAWAWERVSKAWGDGYQQGVADSKEALENGYTP